MWPVPWQPLSWVSYSSYNEVAASTLPLQTSCALPLKFKYQLQEHSPNGTQGLPYYTVDSFITGLVTVELLNKTTFCYLYSFLLQINKNTENIYYSNKTSPLWIDFQGLKETFCSEGHWRWNKEIFSAFCSAITQRSRALDHQEHGLYLPTYHFSNNEKW